MVTPALVQKAGVVDTVCCHTDFDGLCSAAKWIRGGEEPYPGADADAHAIDTRLGTPSPLARTLDRALRAHPRDHSLYGIMVRYLAKGAADQGLYAHIHEAAAKLDGIEAESDRLATGYEVVGAVALCDATERRGRYDKTHLLLLGQEIAPISLVYDKTTVTVAARFDSGIDLVGILGLEGGMPTRVSVSRKRLDEVLGLLAEAMA